jgi:hypothetical protein
VRQTARWILLVLAVFIGIAVLTGLAYGFQSKELVISELLFLAVCGVITKFVEPNMDRWDRGATGEEFVGRVLAQKEAEGWRALHDVSFGRGNIDHIVVGPGGVFAIETKAILAASRLIGSNQGCCARPMPRRRRSNALLGNPSFRCSSSPARTSIDRESEMESSCFRRGCSADTSIGVGGS